LRVAPRILLVEELRVVVGTAASWHRLRFARPFRI
jgi:hypothetical protein